MHSKNSALTGLASSFLKHPSSFAWALRKLAEEVDAEVTLKEWPRPAADAGLIAGHDTQNPLKTFFEQRRGGGRGIWKWLHYFEVYHRHLEKFRGKKAELVEIGVYSGGSMEMWADYLGDGCSIHGIDIEESCLAYASENTSIHIGDQADPRFWNKFLQKVPAFDVVIDDGGHLPHQQITTLKHLLPALRPGGVYICEDVHGRRHRFDAFVNALSDGLDEFNLKECSGSHESKASALQAVIHSVHRYPFVTVIEKRLEPIVAYRAPRHGSQWEPFL